MVQVMSYEQADVVMIAMLHTHTNLQQNPAYRLLDKRVDGMLYPFAVSVSCHCVCSKFDVSIFTCVVRGEVILCILFDKVSPTALGMSVPCKSFLTTSWNLPLVSNLQTVYNFIIVILACNVDSIYIVVLSILEHH